MSSIKHMLTQPWETIWQATLVKLPRAVPTQVLRYTSPLGPQPFILDLPLPSHSDTKKPRTLPVYVFMPSLPELVEASHQDPTAERDAQGKQDEQQKMVKLPVILDFHGGGFYMGSPLEQAPFCAQMARELKAVVLSVDYRMGPIDKFPAAHEDADDVLRAVLEANTPGGMVLRKAVDTRVNEAVTKMRRDVSAARKREASAERRRDRSKERNRDPTTGQKKTKETKETRDERRARKGVSHTQHIATDLDASRVAIAGFSSGGNLALNLAINVPAGSPQHKNAWPSPFPATYATQIPLLLFYPSLDMRQLPSQRHRPEGIGAGGGWFSRLNDNLASSYCPKEKGDSPRISPGLASTTNDLHEKAKMLLVLCGLDTLVEQSEAWVKKVHTEGREKDLVVERYQSMKHGWTQMPESMLDVESRRTREEIFAKTVAFVKASWAGEDPKAALAKGVKVEGEEKEI